MMKRKQVVMDRIDDMDNSLVAVYQALQVPNVDKATIERYLSVVRAKLKEVENLVKLED